MTEACEGLVWVGKLIMEARTVLILSVALLFGSFFAVRCANEWTGGNRSAISLANDNHDKWLREHAPPDIVVHKTCRVAGNALDCTVSSPAWGGPPIRLYCDEELCKVGGP